MVFCCLSVAVKQAFKKVYFSVVVEYACHYHLNYFFSAQFGGIKNIHVVQLTPPSSPERFSSCKTDKQTNKCLPVLFSSFLSFLPSLLASEASESVVFRMVSFLGSKPGRLSRTQRSSGVLHPFLILSPCLAQLCPWLSWHPC